MSRNATINATQFKAKCLGILNRLCEREVDSVTITRRGRVVAVLTRPRDSAEAVRAIYGGLRDSVIIPHGFDLTEPVLDEPLDAIAGKLHR